MPNEHPEAAATSTGADVDAAYVMLQEKRDDVYEIVNSTSEEQPRSDANPVQKPKTKSQSVEETQLRTSKSCSTQDTNTVSSDVLATASDEQVDTGTETLNRLYYTMPRKKRSLSMLFQKKRPKTVAEVGVQVGDTSEDQLLSTISFQVSRVKELCAKQDRVDELREMMNELTTASKDLKETFTTALGTDNVITGYLEAREELVHLRDKLVEYQTENDYLEKRMEDQEKELDELIRERDEFKSELDLSVSRMSELETSVSSHQEDDESMGPLTAKLRQALKKRDKYKRLFLRLKKNNSLILDQYITQLNAALSYNREIIERAVNAGGSRRWLEELKFVASTEDMEQERNRLVDKVDYLDAVLMTTDMLVEEMKENMDNMMLLFEEYKKAGYDLPNEQAKCLFEQIETYNELMRQKQDYTPNEGESIKEQLINARTAKLLLSCSLEPFMKEARKALRKETGEASETETEGTEKMQEGDKTPTTEKEVTDKNAPRTVHSHGDTPDTKKTPDAKQVEGLRRRDQSKEVVDLAVTKSTPDLMNRGSFGDSAILDVEELDPFDRHMYSFF